MARRALVSLIAASALSACGGGSGSGSALPSTASVPAMAPPPTLAPSSNPHSGAVTPTSTTPLVAQAATAGTAGNAKSLAVSLASAPVAGSLIVAFIGTGDASTVTTPPPGWSAAVDAAGHACQAMSGGANAQGEQVYVHTATAGEGAAKYTFTFASSAASAYAIALLEVHNAGAKPIAACASTNPAKDTATAKLASAALTATAANQLPLVGYAPSTSGLTVTRSSGWTGTLYNATQTPYLTLDVEYGPLTSAAGGTVTPATAVSNLSTPTIVYAPSVDVLIDAGTASSPASSAAPSAAPSGAPSAIPASTPSPAPQVGALQDGIPWPASFRPYGPTSYWNRPVSNLSNPNLLANSANIISTAEAGDSGPSINLHEYNSGYADGRPVVFASNTDPLLNTHCNVYCGSNTYTGTVRIPAKARPGTGGDAHLVAIQPNGEEIDFWQVNPASSNCGDTCMSDWVNGGTINAGSINDCGNFTTGSGTAGGPFGSEVGDGCIAAGFIHYNEFIAAINGNGYLNHALITTTLCGAADGSFVYPAFQPVDNRCTGTNGVPNGAHIWLDLTDAQVDALPIKAWEKVLLKTVHHYGTYMMDFGGVSASHTDSLAGMFPTEGAENYRPFGVTPPLETWAQAQGWTPVTISPINGGFSTATRYTFADHWNPLGSIGGWNSGHLHVIDPCYAQGSC
jgi:hypothetical protein